MSSEAPELYKTWNTERQDFEREQYKKADAENLAELNKFSAAGEIDAEYLTPLEDIFEEIEEIVFHASFCLAPKYREDLLLDRCVECGAENISGEDVNHLATCRLNILRDLIATLGDMIS